MRWLLVATLFATIFFLLQPRLDIALSMPFAEFGGTHGFVAFERHPVVYGIYRWVKHISALYIALFLMAGLYKLCCGSRVVSWRAWWFLGLVLLVGSYGAVNLVSKEMVDRPRPRSIVEFGGTMEYVAPLHVGSREGKSFLSGHASAGFYVVAFAMLIRQRKWRVAVYGFGLFLGAAIGAVRVIAGGHFVSDIVFSGIIMLWTIHALAYIILRAAPTIAKEPPCEK